MTDVRGASSYLSSAAVCLRILRRILFFQAEDGIRDIGVTGVQTCALPIFAPGAVADLTVFDPSRVRDRATYDDPTRLVEGVEYVVLNGELAVDGGSLVRLDGGQIGRESGRERGQISVGPGLLKKKKYM